MIIIRRVDHQRRPPLLFDKIGQDKPEFKTSPEAKLVLCVDTGFGELIVEPSIGRHRPAPRCLRGSQGTSGCAANCSISGGPPTFPETRGAKRSRVAGCSTTSTSQIPVFAYPSRGAGCRRRPRPRPRPRLAGNRAHRHHAPINGRGIACARCKQKCGRGPGHRPRHCPPKHLGPPSPPDP